MKVQWEYDLVEKPFCEQLKLMGWQWLEGDTDVPYLTERENFREVLLKGRLAAALRKLNFRDGQPWLDDARIARAIRDLEQAGGHRLMEINQSATELLLKGTVTEGLPDWEQGRPQPVKFIDFENWANNDFLVINQFKVELTSGRGHVIPDAVLFVNGIPLVVAEFKSPGIESPLQEAINQLLRYSNQRRELFPTLYSENEGVERLFHTNQLLIASNFFEARAATIGAPPEAYREWADTSPIPMSTVAEELGLLSSAPDEGEAEQELATLGPEQSERAGTPLFFRKPEQRPPAMRHNGATLRSQQILVAGMLRPEHLLDLVRNFTVFQQVDGKTRKVVARYQQFREESIHFEEFPVLNESEKIVVLVDEAHRSHTRALHRNLRKALPNAAIIGFTGTPILSKEKTETREIFGEFIDKYILQDSELDGATVPILYEGRTAEGLVKDAPGLDQLFEDIFRDYSPDELAVIKAKYATEGDVFEAPMLIEKKARDMLRHYVGVVLPEGFKAQVVATSRQAAVTYYEKLEQARQELIADLEAVAPATLALPDDEVEKLDPNTRFRDR